jgi:hypothetical protein
MNYTGKLSTCSQHEHKNHFCQEKNTPPDNTHSWPGEGDAARCETTGSKQPEAYLLEKDVEEFSRRERRSWSRIIRRRRTVQHRKQDWRWKRCRVKDLKISI